MDNDTPTTDLRWKTLLGSAAAGTVMWGIMIAAALALAGCAKSSSEIAPAYISPMAYQNWSCPQMMSEMHRVSSRASQVAGIQDDNASDDAIATGVAIVVFWPAAFLINGDGHTAAELARLRGEMEALERASIEKNCAVRVQRGGTSGLPRDFAPTDMGGGYSGGGLCEHPEDRDSAGRRCGRRAASARAGGR